VTGAGVPAVSVDFRNVQATIVSLYKCPILRHLIFRFGEAGGARASCASCPPARDDGRLLGRDAGSVGKRSREQLGAGERRCRRAGPRQRLNDPDRRRQDAIAANRAAHAVNTAFTIPGADGGGTIASLPDFMHTKGTVFLLYPSRSTLDRLSGGG
jgi:hypothetical protein